MYFELSITINRSPADVFAFLRDKDEYPQEDGSPVLILEKITPGPPGVGTRYREVVQMLPFVRGEILSEITRFEPGEFLEEDFQGAGMEGHLAYQFLAEGGGTRLVQRETISWRGLLKVLEPMIRLALSSRLRERLDSIKTDLEKGVDMGVKETLKSQYWASLEMLKQTMVKCPEPLWYDPEYMNSFWHIVYHVLFYTHFYLGPSERDFVPWEKHKDEFVSLGPSEEGMGAGAPYSKEELLAYLGLCREQVEEEVSRMDLGAESGFHWLPFDKLELQIYNIRHVQQHTGELCERLGAKGDIEVAWVGMK